MKKLIIAFGIIAGFAYYLCAEEESFIVPKKKSVPSVSYEQLCELFGDVMHTCNQLQHSLADVCNAALNATRDVLTRDKKSLWIKASKQQRTETARRIKKLIIRIKSIEKELVVLGKELDPSLVN